MMPSAVLNVRCEYRGEGGTDQDRSDRQRVPSDAGEALETVDDRQDGRQAA
jgi:hypothetical protein